MVRKYGVSVSKPSHITTQTYGDYTLYIKNDGYDYTKLWRGFVNGNRDGVRTIRLEDVREVYYIEDSGRKFILKIDRYVPQRFEKKIRYIFFSPYFSRQMRQINYAIQQGCDLVPEYYFVAEKKQGLVITESYILQEYIEGEHFSSMEIARDNAGNIIAAVKKLHSFGLVHCDLNLDNIFVTPSGIRFIDFSSTGSRLGGLGKDILRLRDHFGITMPLTSLLEKVAYWYTTVKFFGQKIIRGRKRTG